MAEEKPTSKTGGEGSESFEQYLSGAPEAPGAGEVVTLTGVVYRSATRGKFTLVLPSGESAELDVDAVRSYKPVPDPGTQRLVQLEVPKERLPDNLAGIATLPQADQITLKEATKDPQFDTLAIYNTHPIIDHVTVAWLNHPHTLPILDVGTIPAIDQGPKFPASDQTIAEGVIPDPTGGQINPIAGVGGGLTAPFVMATPHHAPQAAVMMQQLAASLGAGGAAGAGAGLKPAAFDTIKEVSFETLKEPIHDTFKEVIRDPITIWESTGTLAEGGGPVQGGGGPIWNFPGLMF
jgi:hypothetical protein